MRPGTQKKKYARKATTDAIRKDGISAGRAAASLAAAMSSFAFSSAQAPQWRHFLASIFISPPQDGQNFLDCPAVRTSRISTSAVDASSPAPSSAVVA